MSFSFVFVGTTYTTGAGNIKCCYKNACSPSQCAEIVVPRLSLGKEHRDHRICSDDDWTSLSAFIFCYVINSVSH